MKNRPLHERFGFALAGLRVVFKSERSFRTECMFAVAAAVVLAILRPGWQWAALIVICTMLVMALELLNSALEYLIDHIHPDIHPAIKHSKDAAAAAVLVASCGSVCVAALMLMSIYFN
jgi:undecaprenol kinase